jgi:hypothetical protein
MLGAKTSKSKAAEGASSMVQSGGKQRRALGPGGSFSLSFVSLTQQPGASVSAGHSALDMILSDARYGPEVIGDYRREAIAASMQRGRSKDGLADEAIEMSGSRPTEISTD